MPRTRVNSNIRLEKWGQVLFIYSNLIQDTVDKHRVLVRSPWTNRQGNQGNGTPRGKMKLEIVPHTVFKATRTQNIFNVVVANKDGCSCLQKRHHFNPWHFQCSCLELVRNPSSKLSIAQTWDLLKKKKIIIMTTTLKCYYPAEWLQWKWIFNGKSAKMLI